MKRVCIQILVSLGIFLVGITSLLWSEIAQDGPAPIIEESKVDGYKGTLYTASKELAEIYKEFQDLAEEGLSVSGNQNANITTISLYGKEIKDIENLLQEEIFIELKEYLNEEKLDSEILDLTQMIVDEGAIRKQSDPDFEGAALKIYENENIIIKVNYDTYKDIEIEMEESAEYVEAGEAYVEAEGPRYTEEEYKRGLPIEVDIILNDSENLLIKHKEIDKALGQIGYYREVSYSGDEERYRINYIDQIHQDAYLVEGQWIEKPFVEIEVEIEEGKVVEASFIERDGESGEHPIKLMPYQIEMIKKVLQEIGEEDILKTVVDRLQDRTGRVENEQVKGLEYTLINHSYNEQYREYTSNYTRVDLRIEE